MTHLTPNKITFLSDIDRSYRVNKSEKYFYYPLGNVSEDRISDFLGKMENSQAYLIFPFLSTTGNPNDTYLRLSNQILVNKYSNVRLLSKFLGLESDFYVEDGVNHCVYLKIKRVYITMF